MAPVVASNAKTFDRVKVWPPLAATSFTWLNWPATTIRLPTWVMAMTRSFTVVELSRICGVRASGVAATTAGCAGPSAAALPGTTARVDPIARPTRPQKSRERRRIAWLPPVIADPVLRRSGPC
jgi:hypothetical protein